MTRHVNGKLYIFMITSCDEMTMKRTSVKMEENLLNDKTVLLNDMEPNSKYVTIV